MASRASQLAMVWAVAASVWAGGQGPLGLSMARAAEFARPPQVARDGDKCVITFAVKSPCDAAVAVVGKDGRIVRHLAAGVLGPNAPGPFQKDSLSQSLTWDRRDDDGRAVPPGEYLVRVGLGLTPRFDRILGYNPYRLGTVRVLAVGPDGNAYAFHVGGGLHPSDGTSQCAVFSREGKYLRTILPYPANLPEDRLAGIRRIEIAPGVRVPFIYQVETRSLVPGAGELPSHRAAVTRDGRLAFVGIHELGRYAGAGPARLTVIRTDGSIPQPVLGPVIAQRTQSGVSLALSPDEKTIYAAGLEEKNLAHAVYRLTWDGAKAEVFVGAPGTAGRDDGHLNNPVSVATDKDGNVYVADRGNDRVAVFSPAGSMLGSLAVSKPERVEVHPKSGRVYVIGGSNKEMLFKFSGYKDAKELARVRLPYFRHEEYSPVMAVDGSADPTVIWVGSSHAMQFTHFGLLRIEDRDDRFGELVEVTAQDTESLSVGPVLDIGLEKSTERLYIGSKGFQICLDGRTGKRLQFKAESVGGSGKTAAVGQDGYIYLYWDYPEASLSRLDLTGRPVPFAATGSSILAKFGSPRLRGRGLDVSRDGNIYVLQQVADKAADDATDANSLYVYGPDGTLKQAKLVDSAIRSLNSVRVDGQGNIYMAVGLRPGKDLLPPDLAGKVPADKTLPESVNQVNYYPLMYGSIVKFPPTGGRIRQGAGGVACNFGYGNSVEVNGASWIVPGVSPSPSWRTAGTPDVCLCESPRIDLDGFARVFFPDAGRFRVGVLDSNGNVVTWFGGYGNPDSAGTGPGSTVPTPEIPFTWPHVVAAGDEAVYVGDRLACRVVRVLLDYKVRQDVPVP